MARFVALVASPAPLPQAVVGRLAKLLDTDAYSIRLALNRPRPLVLGCPVDEAAASEATAQLRELGHEAYAFGVDQLRGLAEPIRPRTLELHRNHVRFVLAEHNLVLSKWDNLFLLVLGKCRRRVREATQYAMTEEPGPTFSGPYVSVSSRDATTPRLDIYFFDGSSPVRIDCDRFSFAFLGSKIGPSDSQSLATTIRAVRRLARHVTLDEGFEQFRRRGGSAGGGGQSGSQSWFPGSGSTERTVIDDGPRFDFYSRLSFLINLKRAEQSV